MEHTPGPWYTKESKRFPSVYINAEKGGTIATTYAEGDFYNTQLPNARLIAAAPRLLAALVGLYSFTKGSGGTLHDCERSTAIREAAAAIAEATAE